MNKADLIKNLANKEYELPIKTVELAVKQILELMSQALANSERIEIRGFGSFSLRQRPTRQARNPKTGAQITIKSKSAIHFKPGKELKGRVNNYQRSY